MLQQRGRTGLLQCWLVGLLALAAEAFTALNRTEAKSKDVNVGVTYVDVAEYIANSDDDPDAGFISAIVPEDEVDDFVENATLQAGKWAANREEADKALEEALAIQAEYNEMITSRTDDDGFLTLNREVLALSRKYTAALKKAAEFHPHLKEAAEEEERQTASFEEMLKVKTEKMNTSRFFSEDNIVAAANRLSTSMGSIEGSEIEKTEALKAAHAALAEFNAMDRPHDLSSREEWAAAFINCANKSLKIAPDLAKAVPDLPEAVREVYVRAALFQEYLPIEAKLRAIEENPDAYSQEQIAALTRRRYELEWESMQEDCYIPEASEDDDNPDSIIQIVGRKNYANFLIEKGHPKEEIDEMLAEFGPPGLRVETFGVVGSAEEIEEYKAKYHAFHVERRRKWRKELLAIHQEMKWMKATLVEWANKVDVDDLMGFSKDTKFIPLDEPLAKRALSGALDEALRKALEETKAMREELQAMEAEFDELGLNKYTMSDQAFSDAMRRYAALQIEIYAVYLRSVPKKVAQDLFISLFQKSTEDTYMMRVNPHIFSEYIICAAAMNLSALRAVLGALGMNDHGSEDFISAVSLINLVTYLDTDLVEIAELEGFSVSEFQARESYIQDLVAIDHKKEAINAKSDAFSQEEIVDVMRRSATIFQNLGEFYPELKTAAFVLRETDNGQKELVVDYNATSEGKFDEAIAIAKMKTKRQHSRWLPRWFRPSKKAIVPILRVAALYTVLHLLLRI